MDTKPNAYLYHRSDLGEFFLGSDHAVPTFMSSKKTKTVIDATSIYHSFGFTGRAGSIAGRALFPGNMIDGQQTINQQRGRNAKVADRFDLTIECIRRY